MCVCVKPSRSAPSDVTGAIIYTHASGAHLLGGTYNVDRLKLLAVLAILKQRFQNSVNCQRAVLAFVLTQHKITFSCLFSTQKNAVSLPLAAQTRAWTSLLTVNATLRLV